MEKQIISNEEATSKILMILSRHVGIEKSLDMGELYTRVFDEPYSHKINHTRRLRTIITALRQKGVPIGSTAAKNGGGYYIVRAGSELDEYCGRLRRAALRKLFMESKLRKISMGELLGQMRLNFCRGSAGTHSSFQAYSNKMGSQF